jgi:hypothetical protein
MNTTETPKEKKYTKSKKGFDFNNKPINKNTNTEMYYGYWAKRLFIIKQKSETSCCLYALKNALLTYSFTIKYKNLTLVKEETNE